MNERIKELMTQSGMISESSIPGMVVTTNMSLKTAEKFAELIVRECASIADEPTSQPFDSYGKKVKQHFGVSE